MRTWSTRLTAAGIVVIAAILLAPVLYELVHMAFTTPDGAWSATNFSKFANRSSVRTLKNTAIFALGSTVLALLIGSTQAWIAERTGTRLRNLAYVGAIVSLGMPYLIYVIAWSLLLGSNGIVSSLLNHVFNTDATGSASLNSLGGMIMIEGFVWSPLVFLFLAGAMQSMNPSLEEAARVSGASLSRLVWRVTVPLSKPALLAVGLLVVMRAMESFEVPAIIGLPGHVQVVATSVYLSTVQVFPPDYGYASALAVALMVVVGILLLFYSRLTRRGDRYQVISGEGFRPARVRVGRAAWFLNTVSVVIFFVTIALPFLILLWISLEGSYSGLGSLTNAITFTNYATAVGQSELMRGTVNTVLLCGIGAVCAAFLTSLAAWLVIRGVPGSRLVDQVVSLPLVLPGIVLGVALLAVSFDLPLPLAGSRLLLGIGYLITFLPFSMRFVYAGMLQIHPSLEEAARVSGARPSTIFRRVVSPLLFPSTMLGALFVFLLGVRTLSMPILVSSSNNPVAAVSLYDLWYNGSTTEVAAFGVLWTVVMVAIAGGLFGMSRRFGIRLY